MPKITEEQRSWWHWEFEDFEFRGDLVTGELAVDAPIPSSGEDDLPRPGLVLEVARIALAGEPLGRCETYPHKRPHYRTSVCRNWKQTKTTDGPVIEGEAADLHYSLLQRAELLKLLEDKLDNESVACLEQRDEGR